MLIQAAFSVCWYSIFRGITSHQQHSNQNIWKAKTKSNEIREARNTKTFEKVSQTQNREDEPVQENFTWR